jgi:hypothetical protein
MEDSVDRSVKFEGAIQEVIFQGSSWLMTLLLDDGEILKARIGNKQANDRNLSSLPLGERVTVFVSFDDLIQIKE